MKRRIISAVLAAALLLALSSCGKTDEEAETSAAETASAGTSAPETATSAPETATEKETTSAPETTTEKETTAAAETAETETSAEKETTAKETEAKETAAAVSLPTDLWELALERMDAAALKELFGGSIDNGAVLEIAGGRVEWFIGETYYAGSYSMEGNTVKAVLNSMTDSSKVSLDMTLSGSGDSAMISFDWNGTDIWWKVSPES